MRINKRILHYVKTMYMYVAVVGMLSFLTASSIIVQAGLIAHIINGAFLLKETLAPLQTALFILLAALLVRAAILWGGEAITTFFSCTPQTDLRPRLFTPFFKLMRPYT